MYDLLFRDNGFVHVCGHRGNSLYAPENTLAALTSARDHGGTSAEIDVMLSADGELVLMHDDFLDRTTNGTGLVSRAPLAYLRALDAGSWFDPRFAGERVPTLTEALAHAEQIGLSLVIELKEFQNVGRAIERIAEIAAETGALRQAIFISFDHVVLKRLKDRVPGIRTEGILHARHADVLGLVQAAGLDSVSMEHGMFHPDDAATLHRAGVAVRLHFLQPGAYLEYAEAGLDLLSEAQGWLATGLVDTVSGDDVAFLARLCATARRH